MNASIRNLLPALLLALSAVTTAAAEEVTLEHGGLTLNARLETAREDWQAGPVVLITHGTLAHNGMEIIATLQGLLMDQGLSSLAINLSLGLDDRHGMYDCAVPHAHRHTDALDEIGVWLDWLKRRGVRRVVLAGHSRGGNQTAWFAAERPDPAVTGVVLIAPATWSESHAVDDYQRRFKTELAPLLARADALVEAGRGAEWMEHTGFVYCPDAKVQARSFVSYHAPEPRLDTPRLLDGIEVPVLVVAGSMDEVVPDVAEKVEPRADGERVRLVVIEGAGHFFRDLNADELAEHVGEFIDAL